MAEDHGGEREREMEAQDRLLKTPEVAQRYGCSVRTVIRMRQRDEGPKPVPIGPRMLRYRESDVERYLNGERESTGDGTQENKAAGDCSCMSPAEVEDH